MDDKRQPERRNCIRTFIDAQVQVMLAGTRASAALVNRGKERRIERRRQSLLRRSTLRPTADRRQKVTDRR